MEVLQFLEKLSSDAPTPGGGSASAMAGALAASLIAMVAGLSSEKGKLRKKEREGIRRKALAIQRRLYRAIEEDAKSYDAVLEAFRLPKETERERLRRAVMIQRAFQRATVTPRLVCEKAVQLLELSGTLLLKGNPSALSDTAVAVHLSNAALEGGMINIRINLGSIRDRSFREKGEASIRRFSKKRESSFRSECATVAGDGRPDKNA